MHDSPGNPLYTVETRLTSSTSDTNNIESVLPNDVILFSQTAWSRSETFEILLEQIEGEHRCLRFMVSIRSQQLLMMLNMHKWHVEKSRAGENGESRHSMNMKRYGEVHRS